MRTVAVASTSVPRALDRLGESQRAELIVIVPRGHETPFGALFGPAAAPAS